MPPTKASNLYSTFPLNPTRLPVTSDMACQKLSFTAHGQHGGSKDQIQWSNPSHFFSFRAADIELKDDKTEQVEAAAREREAVQSRWSEGEKPAGLCMSWPGLGRWQSHTKGSEKPRNLKWPLQTISAVKKERRGHPVMWNAPRKWLKGKRMSSVSFICTHMNQEWFFSLWKKLNFKSSFSTHSVFLEIKSWNEHLKKATPF